MDAEGKADALLRSPLGRALMAELLGLDPQRIAEVVGVDLGGTRYRVPDTSSESTQNRPEPGPAVVDGPASPSEAQVREVREVVDASVAARTGEWLVPAPEADTRSAAGDGPLLRRVGDVVRNIGFGRTSLWMVLQSSLAAVREDLRPAASELVAHPATAWWWSPASWVDQRGCGVPPTPSGAVGSAHAPGAPDDASIDSGGQWWVSPNSRLGTTRAIPSRTCVYALCRDGHQAYVEPESEVILPVDVDPRARVYEVDSVQDWVDLVDRYPRATPSASHRSWQGWSHRPGPWWVPDWRRCAQNWDGVHISVGGHLASAYNAWPTSRGLTYLAGWNPDETVWLTEAMVTFGSPATGQSLAR